jgi:hypothetical protein
LSSIYFFAGAWRPIRRVVDFDPLLLDGEIGFADRGASAFSVHRKLLRRFRSLTEKHRSDGME